MNNVVVLFSGQGAQKVGMGQDLAEAYPVAAELFRKADEVLGRSLTSIMFEGPMEELTLTVNLQPAVTAVNLACLTILEKEGVRPALTAGHSLGEYSALRASGVISSEDTLRLVFKT